MIRTMSFEICCIALKSFTAQIIHKIKQKNSCKCFNKITFFFKENKGWVETIFVKMTLNLN